MGHYSNQWGDGITWDLSQAHDPKKAMKLQF